MPDSSTPVEVFYSYAHKDETFRIKLETHLSLLQRQGLITTWHDRHILPGTDWSQVIDEHLERASVILLLVSADFLASDYCYGLEMQRALERHQANEACVIPILLRPVDWNKAPFAYLQVLPTGAKPITKWRNRDEAFTDVAAGIRRVIEDLPSLHASAPRAALPRIWNVPYPRNPYFTGREAIVQQLTDALRTGKTAAITQPQAIGGLGGIGKTQCAVEYAYRYHHDYQTVLWVQAETRQLLISDFVTVAELLNLPERDAQDQNEAVEAVKRWMKEHRDWLLILDNADDLAMVRAFVPPVVGGHLLLTTRAQTMGRLAHSIELVQMEPEEGALFLLRRAGIIEESDVLEKASEAERNKAKEISQAMDGLPLALDQAGAYIEETSCGLADYLDLYKKRGTALLKRRGGLVADHPEPIATTWSLSFKKVGQANPAAAELLCLCAFLAPDAIPEEIISKGAPDLGSVLQSVAIDPIELNSAIEELHKFSFVKRDPDVKTLTIHRLVQAVLKESMNEQTQHKWAERTVRAVNRAFPFSDATDYRNWQHCQQYLPHAQTCMALIDQWAFAFPQAGRLAIVAGNYLKNHARYAEAEDYCKRAISIYVQLCGPEHPHVAMNLNNLAALYLEQDKYTDAEPLLQQAIAIGEKTLGLENATAAMWFANLGVLYLKQSKYTDAEPLLQRAIEIGEKTLGPEHPELAMWLNNFSELYAFQGKYEQAEQYLLRAIAIGEKTLGLEHPTVAKRLNNLANLYWKQSKYEQAKPLYQRAVIIGEKMLGPEHPLTLSFQQNLQALLMQHN